MILYPNNQTYVIIPAVLGPERFPEYFAVARKSINEKLWIWHYPNGAKLLKEFVEDPDCETLTHKEALEKMATSSWCTPEEEL